MASTASPSKRLRTAATTDRPVRKLLTVDRPPHGFTLPRRDFAVQYAEIYTKRVAALRGACISAARRKWSSLEPKVAFADRLRSLHCGKQMVVIGTVFRDMPLRPTALDEYTRKRGIEAPPPRENYCSDEDTFILEDESCRVNVLVAEDSPVHMDQLCTGVVVALLGVEDADGNFVMHDVCLPGPPPQAALPALPAGTAPSYVLLVSDLRIGHPEANPLLDQMLVDYVTGALGTHEFHEDNAKLSQVIVVGSTFTSDNIEAASERRSRSDQGQLSEKRISALTSLKRADHLLAELCSSVAVDILPGPNDPTNFSLPQQPLSPYVLPLSESLSSCNAVTNPHLAVYSGTHFVVCSGQVSSSLARFSKVSDPLDVLELTLRSRHLAPIAPDALEIYPFKESDPFVLQHCPHVYACGGQASFATKLYEDSDDHQRVRLIAIPSFYKTGVAVLVNIHSLEAKPIQFAA